MNEKGFKLLFQLGTKGTTLCIHVLGNPGTLSQYNNNSNQTYCTVDKLNYVVPRQGCVSLAEDSPLVYCAL